MNRSFTVLSALITCVVVICGNSFAAGTFARSGIERNVVEFKLKNGMCWLLMKKGAAPVFAGVVQVRVGGADEEEGKTGLAHMLEHMAFKGTKDISAEELWDAFVVNGASDLNAYTSKDITAYHAKMPVSKLPLWLYLKSEMIKHSALREFDKERDVVLEELIGKIENNPVRKMDAMLLGTAFTTSPYRWPTIGKKEDVARLKEEYLEAFKRRFYVPGRMVGAIVGNIDIEEAKKLIERYFGDMPPARDRQDDLPVEPPQNEQRSVEVRFDSEPRLSMAYHKPTLPDHDDYVFDVISYILCFGENSRLNKKLVYDRKMVRGVSCDSSYPGARLDNLFVIITEPIKGHSYEAVKNAIREELERLKTEPVSESELKKARNNTEKDFIFGLSDNEGVAHSLAFYETVTGDWRYIVRHADVINRVSAKDVMDVARKYFNKNNETTAEIVK